MTDFLSDYFSYLQESRLKAGELKYYEINQHFWKDMASSHWREKRANFHQNFETVLHNLDDDVESAWGRQNKNFIARDNLFHYFSKVDAKWINDNMDTLAFDSTVHTLVRTRPVVFLSFHNFYQILIPIVLAQYFGPVSSFILDEEAEIDALVRSYLSEMYKNMTQSLSGGSLLKVGVDKSDTIKRQVNQLLAQKGNIYAAIDMVHPLLGNKTKVSLTTKYFEMSVLMGVIETGLKNNAQFAFPFISLVQDGTLRLEMFILNGSTTEEVLESYRRVFDSLISRDIAAWEGASLLSYKEGRFS